MRFLAFLFVLFISLNSFAGQDKIIDSIGDVILKAGTSKATRVQGAFQVESTSKASRPYPSMTTAQRDVIASPSIGDTIFNTTTNKINIYSSGTWGEVSGSGGGAGSINGSGTSGTISKWSATATLADSQILDDGTTVTVSNKLSVGKTLSVAGGKVTSLNKVDGSFEDGVSLWSASVGTIVKTANTEMQGNYVGVWSGTGAGTLDLQWTATASNTYTASVQVKLDVPADYSFCAVVNGVETGCKSLAGYVANKIYKLQVDADSVIGTGFYLRLKHTGSGAFSAIVDDGKIKPFTFNTANLTEQQGSLYNTQAGFGSSATKIPYFTTTRSSSGSGIYSVSNDSTNGMAITVIKKAKIDGCYSGSFATQNANIGWSLNAPSLTTIFSSVANANKLSGYTSTIFTSNSSGGICFTYIASPGDIIRPHTDGTNASASSAFISVTAQAISDNVIQSYSNDRVGETIYSIQNTAPQGFISAQGSILGKTSGSHQGEAYKALYDYSWAIASATAGEPYLISSAKGASAQADWDAGKTITINESGLFTRASGGNAGAVGAKQLDAFQGHWHVTMANGSAPYTAFGYPNSNGASTGPNTVGSPGTIQVFDPKADASGISPRTATETRSINIAKYVYIRYAQSVPTLLALPTRSEVFSSSISASGVASNATQNFVTSCTNATPSVCSLWSRFGVAPICWSHTLDITKRAEVTATTATTATVARTDTGTAFNLFCHLK